LEIGQRCYKIKVIIKENRLALKVKTKWLYASTLSIFLLLLIIPLSGCSSGISCVPSVAAEIVLFEPATGIFYPGDEVTSTLQFRNTGSEPLTFWIGYSVKSQSSEWYDVEAHPLSLGPKGLSLLQHKSWLVPEKEYVTGYYTVAMAVWDAEPGTAGAEQLDYREAIDSFQILTHIEQFDRFNRKLWEKSSHSLGKSYLDPDNVDIGDGYAKIKVPAGAKDGGEFGTKASFTHGTYRANIQVVPISGVVTGFFLYHGTGGNGDEIDIELYHEDEWYVAFTTWSDGDMTGTEKKRLKFDPSAGFHEYRIDFYPEQVNFFVDDQQMYVFKSGLPDEPMRLLVNTWYPDWLYGHPPKKDMYTIVDWIQY
jgi:hypothetical protein